MMSISEALRECRIQRNSVVPIFELIKICDMPISDFKEKFWAIYDQLNLFHSSRMQFWQITDEDWNNSDKYYAYSKGIKNKDRENMIELFRGHEARASIYYVGTGSLIKQNIQKHGGT